jgi:hypothetical protein
MLGALLGGSLLSGVLGLVGAGQQAGAAERAASETSAAARNAAALQQQQYQQSRNDLQPYMQAGSSAVSQLGSALGLGGSLSQGFSVSPEQHYQQASQGFEYNPYTGMNIATRASGLPTQQEAYQKYAAPINVNLENDPGYQARLAAGQQAIQGGQAALGKFFSGDTGRALTEYGQELASNEYQNAYNRELAQRQLGSQLYQQGVAGDLNQRQYETQQQQAALSQDLAQRQYMGDVYNQALNQYNTGQQNEYNRLYGLAGLGQGAASGVASLGSQSAQLQGSYGLQGAQALAGGYQNQANAWSGGLQNVGNQLMSGLGTYLKYDLGQQQLQQQQNQYDKYIAALQQSGRL